MPLNQEALRALTEDAVSRFVGEVDPDPDAVLEALGGRAVKVSRPSHMSGGNSTFVVTGVNGREAVVYRTGARYERVRLFEGRTA